MNRRKFMALSGGAAVCPLAAHAQEKVPTKIGVLVLGTPNPEAFWREFREGLRERGYIDRQNVRLELRSAEGKPHVLPQLAAELVHQKVDIIVAYQTPAATAAKQATQDIPIVMAPAGDPVGTGLVASLARPGGNITGLSGTTAEIGSKSLELIREILPSARGVGLLANATDPFRIPFIEQIQVGARGVGMEIKTMMIAEPAELDAAFIEMSKARVAAVIVQPSLPRRPVIDLALKHRLPSVSPTRAFVEAGGLMSYAATFAELFRKAAVYVDKILKGAKPADLPVEQPTKFELAINLKTAKALGLTVPPTLLARADIVIE